jgi:hypothetical protein
MSQKHKHKKEKTTKGKNKTEKETFRKKTCLKKRKNSYNKPRCSSDW